MTARAGRRAWLAVRKVIGAVGTANDKQVYMWERFLLSSRAAPLEPTGPLRWVPSLDGYRLTGSYLPAQNQRNGA
jgi:hypothetical protein